MTDSPANRARAVFNTAPLPHVGRIIAVASGKGGVGKSTCTVNLALALQQLGQRAGVLDADIYGPSMPRMLGVRHAGQPAFRDGLMQPLEGLGLRAMSMGFITGDQAAMLRGPMVTKTLTQFLRGVAWGTASAPLDYLLIDLPPGTGDVAISLAQAVPIGGAIIITTPQEIAVADADKAAQMFARLSIPMLGVIENMSYFTDPQGGRHTLFGAGGGAEMAARHGMALLGQLPLDPALGAAADAGQDYLNAHPGSAVAQAFSAIAAQLITHHR
jgi:ATP-binding protein involved in chromosome partitioning